MRIATIFLLLSIAVFTSTCKKDPLIYDLEKSGFPADVGKILLTRCAVPGCHDEKSRNAAAGLSFISWDELFKGGSGGAAVIPFRHQLSTLFLFTNTFDDLGNKSDPTMPVNGQALNREEMLLLKDWINAGAPDKKGFIKFSDDPNRKKFYITMQGCDQVGVFDVETGLAMRYIDVGATGSVESPHMVRVSPDGKYFYVVFIAGKYVEKYRTSDDSFVGRCEISLGSWNTILITKDSKYGFAADFDGGRVVAVDLETMTVKRWYQSSATPLFVQPHATMFSPNEDILYVFSQAGNYYYTIDISDMDNPFADVSTAVTMDNTPSEGEVHDAVISPDKTKYFVTCPKLNEVRVFDMNDHHLIASIPVGTFPQELSLSLSSDYLFVSCMEDIDTFHDNVTKGVVSVINYNSNTKVKDLKAYYQPHGIAVDDYKKIVYVANRNVNPAGPAPHHSSACTGRNGKLQVFDMQTLEQKTVAPELSVDPYFISIRK